MVGGRRGERRCECLLQLHAHRYDHLADEVVLAGEVVHDDAVADSQPLREPAEGELAEPVVERSSERAIQDIGSGVLRTHGP